MLEPTTFKVGAGGACTPEVMTHRMCLPEALAAPDRLYSVDELLTDRRLAPAEPGVYAWWFDETPPGVPLEGVLERNGWRWLYVGVAKAHPASRSTLRRRLQNHCRDRCASSTLRRTLAVLLKDELGLTLGRSTAGKMVMDADDEVRLTDWMRRHARVAWMADPEPWKLERALIQRGPVLPLNIEGSPAAFAQVLKGARRATG